MQHGENGRRADPGADQHDRAVTRAQDERAARRARLDHVADAQSVVHEAAHHAMRLALDADAEAGGARRARERIAAQDRGRRRFGAQAHGQELARQRRPHRLAGDGRQPHRDHARALTVDRDDPQLHEPGPRERRRVAVGRLLEHLAEGPLPALAQRRDPQRARDIAARSVRKVQQAVDLSDGHRLRSALDALHRVTRLHLAFFEHAQVEAGPVVRHQQRRHPAAPSGGSRRDST